MVGTMGPAELVIVALLALLLFGVPLLTFVVGYLVGQNRAKAAPTAPPAAGPAPAERVEDHASSESVAPPVSSAQPAAPQGPPNEEVSS